MKQKVKFSLFARILTAVVLVLFVVGIVYIRDNPGKLIFFCVLIGIMTLSGIYFCPVSIEADGKGITLHRLMGFSARFAYRDMISAETCYPSAAGIRLCASGGFFGYWGYFNDIMLGTYVGCYGDRNHCFLIKFANKQPYVIGCENPTEMVEFINKHIEECSDQA